MNGLRLLERIALMEENPDQRVFFDREQVINSIIMNLTNILNTKIGSAQTVPDLGTPDFTNFLGRPKSENFEELKRVIQHVIEKYEPRLQDIKLKEIEEENDPFSLSFRVEGKVSTERGEMEIYFVSRVRPEGRVEVGEK
ncbi:type VI secretion system baseplate subunit TssE [Desulfonauticus submarinus]